MGEALVMTGIGITVQHHSQASLLGHRRGVGSLIMAHHRLYHPFLSLPVLTPVAG